MKEILEFMARKHEHLQYNYSPEFGRSPDDCTDIAKHIAKLLSEQGKSSQIIRFSRPQGGLLLPVIFNREVGWGYHDVCICDQDVYDPIIEKPIKLEEYCKKVFGEQIPFEII